MKTVDTPSEPSASELLALTAEIVSAYVSKNMLSAADLPETIQKVHARLASLGTPEEPKVELVPAVPIKKSIFDDHIVCLEDGKKLKMLKRHLSSSYGLSPDEYRVRWSLPIDYPMVAPAYSRKRQELAKKIGLGRKPAIVAPKPKTKRKSAKPASMAS